jgi:hypothetical protein
MTPKGLCIVTRCTSTDELVARLHPFCDDTSIFVTTARVWDVGTASRFAITLADKTVVLHGRCTVTGAWTDGDNEFGRPGVRLELIELAGKSREVFERMQENRKAGEESVKPHPMTMIPMPNEISDAFARAMSAQMPAHVPLQLDDGPTDRTAQPEMLRPAMIVGRAAIVSHEVAIDTTARSSSPPMPPRIAKPSGAKPPPPPPARAPFGTPLQGASPLAPLPTRRARGTDSIVGLGPCPGADGLDPDTLVSKAAPVTVLTIDTVKLVKKVPPLAVELPPVPVTRAITDTPIANTPTVVSPRSSVRVRPTQPPVELRAPSSPYILPANPLAGLLDSAIEGFVDCTIYEDPVGEQDAVVTESIPVMPSTLSRVITELGADKVDEAAAEEVAPYEEAAVIVSLAPVNKAQLPTIDSFAARLPWKSIGRITGVVAVVLMTAFLIMFETGRW